MGSLFEDIFGPDGRLDRGFLYPAFDVGYRGDEYVLDYGLPGIKRSDVQAFHEGQKVIVTWTSRLGENKQESITMPLDAKVCEATCTLRDGLLTIRIPLLKQDEVHPARKSIPISG